MHDEKKPLVINKFPSNTNKSKEHKPAPVLKGKVKERKKGAFKCFLQNFIENDAKNIVNYVFRDILIPSAKDIVYDMITGGLQMGFFNNRHYDNNSNRGRTPQRQTPYTNYNNYSNRRPEPRRDTYYNKEVQSFNDLLFDSRSDAQNILDHLVDLIQDYGQATVNDLYDSVGITGNFTDNKHGWFDLSFATISRTKDGFMINFPRTVVLD